MRLHVAGVPSENQGLLAKTFDNVASVIVMRVALAALAAFVAGAFVQRLLLADFAVKVGPSGIEIGDVSKNSSRSVEELRELVHDLSSQTKAKTTQLTDTLGELQRVVAEFRQGIE